MVGDKAGIWIVLLMKCWPLIFMERGRDESRFGALAGTVKASLAPERIFGHISPTWFMINHIGS
jgi:hypothetical protein